MLSCWLFTVHTFHVVGHGTVGEREVVMQYPRAMLGVGDQKVKREIRCRRWDGACTPVARVALLSRATESAKQVPRMLQKLKTRK